MIMAEDDLTDDEIADIAKEQEDQKEVNDAWDNLCDDMDENNRVNRKED